MKILITVENFEPDRGYTEYYLAKEFALLNNEVFVLSFGESKKIKENLIDKFRVIQLPYIFKIGPYHIPTLNALFYIINFLKRNKIDILHGQPITSPLSLMFIWLRGLFGYKCVGSVITGDYDVEHFLGKLHFVMVKSSVDLIKDKIDRVFAINTNVANFINRMFKIPLDKIEVIPLGADPELFKYDSAARTVIRKVLGLSPEDIVICYSGKIVSKKHLHYLVECLADIIKQHNEPRIKLLIIGNGDRQYVDYLKKMSIKLGVKNNIIFQQTVHRSHLHLFYNASDIAVWPGAPSISIIEAASTGLPVISGSPFFYKEMEEEGMGFIFKRGDIDKLKKYLELLIFDEKLRRKMSIVARNSVLKKFSWSFIAKQYLIAYMTS